MIIMLERLEDLLEGRTWTGPIEYITSLYMGLKTIGPPALMHVLATCQDLCTRG
jgi:hypothetical protein